MAVSNSSQLVILNTEHLNLYFIIIVLIGVCLVSGDNYSSKQKIVKCPLWHVPGQDAQCNCGDSCNGIVSCIGNFLYIKRGNCMTWNNHTKQAELQSCLFNQWNSDETCEQYTVSDAYRIPANISGSDLDYTMCKGYNRQGPQCRQCMEGYGPTLFTDSTLCADCSKRQHLWILYLLLQLTMINLMYLIFIPLQISATSSPFNVTITYIQLILIGFKFCVTLQSRVVCTFGQTFTKVLLTIGGIWNLDFFHHLLPPLCVTSSAKAIQILLFDYVIAIYPLMLTAVILLCLELHDRNCRVIVLLSSPFRLYSMLYCNDWDPKRRILNTSATFFLLSYSKLLFVSIGLLLPIQSHNSQGAVVSNSTALLYDPAIKFFHSEHIPYAIIALVTLVILLLHPLFLLLYPVRSFKRCLHCIGFRRWDVICQIMDIFQGWYKDGTRDTRDYRPLSALCLLLRIGFGCEFIAMVLKEYKDSAVVWEWAALGVFHVMIGMFFYVAKPYKKDWMCHADGWIFTSVGILFLMGTSHNKVIYILGAAIGITMAVFFIFLCAIYQCASECRRFQSSHIHPFSTAVNQSRL